MDVKFVTDEPLTPEVERAIEREFGFEVTLDLQDEDGCEYFIGYSADSVGDGEEDPMPYDECVRCCGFLKAMGIESYAIEGNGGWAMGMIERTDFTGLAFDEETRTEYKRVSDIFWASFHGARPSEVNSVLNEPGSDNAGEKAP